MKLIKKFNEHTENDSILVPVKILEDWIQRLEAMEYSLNETIFVKDDIQKIIDDNIKKT